jgi:hypothetical protein
MRKYAHKVIGKFHRNCVPGVRRLLRCLASRKAKAQISKITVRPKRTQQIKPRKIYAYGSAIACPNYVEQIGTNYDKM